MGMASFTENANQVRKEFTYLKKCFDRLKPEYFKENSSFKEISMGMSGDYKIAIEAGSTMVRIGSMVFGERQCGESAVQKSECFEKYECRNYPILGNTVAVLLRHVSS